ncbi:hypothetical protein DFH07DRAFT_773796 [Mycena maculata]|uniref:Uncharacterized protein n=1 Tax=Mycena maculata TaxID=230809 RepID=A0AAD7J222_9AGAR|nr:hypothetical protein DFH07DRAFT_773796 [Mycena maculata]
MPPIPALNPLPMPTSHLLTILFSSSHVGSLCVPKNAKICLRDASYKWLTDYKFTLDYLQPQVEASIEDAAIFLSHETRSSWDDTLSSLTGDRLQLPPTCWMLPPWSLDPLPNRSDASLWNICITDHFARPDYQAGCKTDVLNCAINRNKDTYAAYLANGYADLAVELGPIVFHGRL